jgi:integrase
VTTLQIGDRLTPEQIAQLAPMIREAMKDKSYELLPLGGDVADYLRAKRKRLTDASYRSYEGTLDKLARDFPDLRVEDFEPPVGTQRIERFLDDRWGDQAPGTYNVCLAHVTDFFKYWRRHGRLHGDPTLLIERARKRDPLRTVFTSEQRRAILGAAEEQRDRVALRLLLDYGLRKGALRAVQFKHFDWQRRELMIFTKGQKIRSLPLPDAVLWTELERLILETQAEPTHFLMCLVKPIPRAGVRRFPARQMSSTAMHRWWYRQLEHAGIVARGETAGEKMHKARHTAGQRVLDATGDLKLTQRLLGHASIQTTGDVYVDYDNAAFAAKMADVLRDEWKAGTLTKVRGVLDS